MFMIICSIANIDVCGLRLTATDWLDLITVIFDRYLLQSSKSVTFALFPERVAVHVFTAELTYYVQTTDDKCPTENYTQSNKNKEIDVCHFGMILESAESRLQCYELRTLTRSDLQTGCAEYVNVL